MYQMAMENNISKSTVAKKPFFIGAIGGIVSGFILMLTGLILSAISYFEQANFHGLEVMFLVAAFIFLATGAHFLDLMDKEKKVKRIEYCRRNGLTDEQCQENKSV